jgi:hypothetical protein
VVNHVGIPDVYLVMLGLKSIFVPTEKNGEDKSLPVFPCLFVATVVKQYVRDIRAIANFHQDSRQEKPKHWRAKQSIEIDH